MINAQNPYISDLPERFRNYISAHKLVLPGDRLLLAVSGGIDSMVMAHLFLQTAAVSGIAHCNFTLRGSESDLDEALVRALAAENEIPFHSVRFNTKSHARRNRISVQMAARDLRYSWFDEIRAENGYAKIAVAHNLNDNIETMLINLTRGTGITGLSGMRPAAGNIIRPLLFATREEIEEYCRQNRVIYREDKSNADTKYTRNKIRHLIIPVLKEINPSVETTLSETAERFSAIDEVLCEYTDYLLRTVSTVRGDSIHFSISQLKEYLTRRVLLFEMFSRYGVTNAMLKDLVSVIKGLTGGQLITPSHRIIKNRGELIVSLPEPAVSQLCEINDLQKFLSCSLIVSADYHNVEGGFKIPGDKFTACIDADKISFPMIIRNWREGDHFYPLGMKQKKKLSDYFIDRKFSLIDKEKILILETEGKIVWIFGERLDDRFRVTESTRKVLVLTLCR